MRPYLHWVLLFTLVFLAACAEGRQAYVNLKAETAAEVNALSEQAGDVAASFYRDQICERTSLAAAKREYPGEELKQIIAFCWGLTFLDYLGDSNVDPNFQ